MPMSAVITTIAVEMIRELGHNACRSRVPYEEERQATCVYCVDVASGSFATGPSRQQVKPCARCAASEKAAIERLGVRVIDASESGWGIINHDLFLSNAEVQKVIRRSIDTSAA